MLAKSAIFLGLVGFSHSAAFGAESPVSKVSADKGGLFPLEVSLNSSYSETPVNRESADHFSWMGFGVDAKGRLPIADRIWIKDASISGSFSIKDEIEYEDNESNLDNSSLTLSGLGIDFDEKEKLRLGLSLNAGLPSNSDDRRFLSYQGSLGATPSLTYAMSTGKIETSIGASFSLARLFFAFDANQGGQWNPFWSYGPGLTLSLSYGKFASSFALKSSEVIFSDGSRKDSSYALSIDSSYELSSAWQLGLSWSQNDRTFGYDGQSSNIQFRYADLTVVSANATYKL